MGGRHCMSATVSGVACGYPETGCRGLDLQRRNSTRTTSNNCSDNKKADRQTDTHTSRHTSRQTRRKHADRQNKTDRQDRQTCRHADTQTHRHNYTEYIPPKTKSRQETPTQQKGNLTCRKGSVTPATSYSDENPVLSRFLMSLTREGTTFTNVDAWAGSISRIAISNCNRDRKEQTTRNSAKSAQRFKTKTAQKQLLKTHTRIYIHTSYIHTYLNETQKSSQDTTTYYLIGEPSPTAAAAAQRSTKQPESENAPKTSHTQTNKRDNNK